MVNYYERPAGCMTVHRCREHRDFGTLSLIFSRVAGLEVLVNNEWRSVPPPPPGAAVMLFGWVTQIRSNGRLNAAMHRVRDPPADADNKSPRRVSAVLFAAPEDAQTPLEPILRDGEARRYISGVSAEAQHMYLSNPMFQTMLMQSRIL